MGLVMRPFFVRALAVVATIILIGAMPAIAGPSPAGRSAPTPRAGPFAGYWLIPIKDQAKLKPCLPPRMLADVCIEYGRPRCKTKVIDRFSVECQPECCKAVGSAKPYGAYCSAQACQTTCLRWEKQCKDGPIKVHPPLGPSGPKLLQGSGRR
jgi:hypothetical protein